MSSCRIRSRNSLLRPTPTPKTTPPTKSVPFDKDRMIESKRERKDHKMNQHIKSLREKVAYLEGVIDGIRKALTEGHPLNLNTPPCEYALSRTIHHEGFNP